MINSSPKLQQQTFTAWLALSTSQRVADLRAYFQHSGCDVRLALSEQCYRMLVPPSAADAEKRLFEAGLCVALAVLRNESGSGRAFARLRVGRMLDLAQRRHGVLSREEVSRHLGGSGEHLGRPFARRTGVSLRHYLLWLRILRAVELLQDPFQPVKRIADALGYADPSNLIREFHRTLGITPSEYRERFVTWSPASTSLEVKRGTPMRVVACMILF